MIKFTGVHDNRTYVGFGLSEENLEKMKFGMPILIHMEELNLDDQPIQEVLIFTGKDETAMLEELKKVGAIGQTTMMKVDPKVEEDG